MRTVRIRVVCASAWLSLSATAVCGLDLLKHYQVIRRHTSMETETNLTTWDTAFVK